MGPIESALVAAHFHDPRAEATGTTNAWGDHIGHTAKLAEADRAALAAATPQHISPEQVHNGFRTALIAAFISHVGPVETAYASSAGCRRNSLTLRCGMRPRGRLARSTWRMAATSRSCRTSAAIRAPRFSTPRSS